MGVMPDAHKKYPSATREIGLGPECVNKATMTKSIYKINMMHQKLQHVSLALTNREVLSLTRQRLPTRLNDHPIKDEYGLQNLIIHYIYQIFLIEYRLSSIPIREKCYMKKETIKNVYNDSLASKSPEFYAAGINKLVFCW